MSDTLLKSEHFISMLEQYEQAQRENSKKINNQIFVYPAPW